MNIMFYKCCNLCLQYFVIICYCCLPECYLQQHKIYIALTEVSKVMFITKVLFLKSTT